ncbi:MAG: PAS domain S-box protein [Syntrophaceae bacterium]|nr:PAS domain S-box protein [Syntrophaceae bacterium]
MESLDNKDNRAIHLLGIAFVLLAAGIGAAGYISYRNYEDQYRAGVEHQLSSIAHLKVVELAHWRKERLGNASIFFGNEVFSSLVSRSFNNPNDHVAQRQLWIWLGKVQLGYSYERLLLFDVRGTLRMSLPDSKEPVASSILKRAAIVMHSEQIHFMEFYRDELNQRIYLTIMVPILGEKRGSPTQGTLVLRMDPETYLYPFIRSWPTVSQTAETLLVRREGNGAVFLNDLRFQKNAALNIRLSLEKEDLPATKAILGQEGIVEGKDYRGVPVIAAIRAIPDSPWFLVARMDLSEVYGSLKERLYLTILFVVALLISVTTFIGFVWRKQRTQFYREKYEAAAALGESESVMQAIADAAQDAILMMDPEGRISYWNPAAERIFDYTSTEAIGQELHSLIAPLHYHEAYHAAFPLFQQKGQGAAVGKTLDLEAIRKDGEEISVQLSLSAIQMKGAWHAVGVLRDVTESRRVDEALRENQSRLADIIEFLPDATLAIDNEKRVILWNKAIEEMTGIPAAEMIGKGDHAYSIPFYGQARPQLMDLVFLNHKEIAARYPSITREGDSLMAEAFCEALHNNKGAWVFAKASPLHDQSGNIVGVIESIRDITEQKRIEKTLQKREEEYRTLVENASDIIFRADITGVFTFVNPVTLRITGYEEAEVIGKKYLTFIRPDMRDETMKFFGRQFVKGIQETFLEYPILTKEGHEVWLGQKTKLLMVDGHVVGFQAVARDIGDRKRMEAEILALSNTDQLTGLNNRRGFLSLAGQQLKLAERNKSGMLLFFADLDGLKWINDTLGHEEGDKALIEAADVFKVTFRASDILARLGGDEYAALAVDINKEFSEIFTARLKSLIDTRNNQENRRYRLSISVGCSYYNPDNPCSIDELMASADKLMYEQKQIKKALLLQGASLSSRNPHPSMSDESMP